MFDSLKTLIVKVAPVAVLAVVLVASFKLAHTDRFVTIKGAATDAVASPLATPVAPQAATQAVLIEANASADGPVEVPAISEDYESDAVAQDEDQDEDQPETNESPATKEEVWEEITDAISGLNELVGAEMFLDVRHKQKGQMEIRLDGGLWKRVHYQTRVDLKSDISDLWHLYVREYGNSGSSVVYFMNHSDGRVIDIFSKAK